MAHFEEQKGKKHSFMGDDPDAELTNVDAVPMAAEIQQLKDVLSDAFNQEEMNPTKRRRLGTDDDGDDAGDDDGDAMFCAASSHTST